MFNALFRWGESGKEKKERKGKSVES